MTSIAEQWAHGTPERTVANAFAALRDRDGARLAALATRASIRALDRRVVPELDTGPYRPSASSIGNLTDSQAAAMLGRAVAGVPKSFTDMVRCSVLGHVLESPDVAHVVIRLAWEGPGQGSGPMQPEPQIASTELVDGDWKLVLDVEAELGMPGFRGVWWTDDPRTTAAATAD